MTNSYGCTDSVFKYVRIRQESTVYVPNAFTPNQDGVNETFRPYCSGIYKDADYEMLIYDRWGMQVFLTRDLDKGWDGRLKDRVCQQDVYVWRVNVTFKDGGQLTDSGDVTLIR